MNSAISITLVRNKNEKYDATFIYFMKSTCTSVNTIQGHTTATILLYATPLSQFINSPSRTDLFLSVLQKIFCETVLHWGAGLAACKPRSAHCKFCKLRPTHNFASLQEPQREKRLTDLTDFQVVFEETGVVILNDLLIKKRVCPIHNRTRETLKGVTGNVR